jgi:hypothetical protein
MNNSRPDREKLLAETFHGDWSAGTAAGFARQAAAAARRRQSYQRVLVATGITAGIAAALIVTLRQPRVLPSEIRAAATPAPACEIISDDELLALLQDCPLLVVQNKDGGREFILLGN